MTAPWLANDPPLDYKAATIEALVAEWQAHRNDVVGQMCADEVCRRVARGDYGEVVGATA